MCARTFVRLYLLGRWPSSERAEKPFLILSLMLSQLPLLRSQRHLYAGGLIIIVRCIIRLSRLSRKRASATTMAESVEINDKSAYSKANSLQHRATLVRLPVARARLYHRSKIHFSTQTPMVVPLARCHKANLFPATN